jgi:hypothetical protein
MFDPIESLLNSSKCPLQSNNNTISVSYHTAAELLQSGLYKGQRGLYFWFDPYLNTTWYVGNSVKSTEGIYKRLSKEARRLTGQTNNTGFKYYLKCREWQTSNQYDIVEKAHIGVISLPDIFGDIISDTESFLISSDLTYINAYVNGKKNDITKFDRLQV